MSYLKFLHPLWRVDTSKRQDANAAILGAIEAQMNEVEQESLDAKLQLKLHLATGEWLDMWGERFGIPRDENEKDNVYRERIISYVLTERGTIPAIQDAVKRFMDDPDTHIEVYEPYQDIFYLNDPDSKLNGRKKLIGEYYRFAVIDIKMSKGFPEELFSYLNDYVAGGVRFLISYEPGKYDPNYQEAHGPSIESLGSTSDSIHSIGNSDVIRGNMNITRLRESDTNKQLFYLNQSQLNSTDVLSGDFSVNREYQHLISQSETDITPTQDTLLNDVASNSEELSTDFYVFPRYNDERIAKTPVPDSTNSYIYLTFSLYNYLEDVFYDYLQSLAANGSPTKNEWLMLTENPYLQFHLQADVSPTKPLHTDVQVFHLGTGNWVTLKELQLKASIEKHTLSLGSLTDYVNDQGFVFTRLRTDTSNQDQERNIGVGFYEIGFYRSFGTRLMIHQGIASSSTEVIQEEIV